MGPWVASIALESCPRHRGAQICGGYLAKGARGGTQRPRVGM